MSITGRYKMIDGEMVKVSDIVPKLASRVDGVYYPGKPYVEHFAGNDPVLITSKGEKKAEMARRGIRENTEDDVPRETIGKIFSYKDQPHRKRNLQPRKKVDKRLEKKVAQKFM